MNSKNKSKGSLAHLDDNRLTIIPQNLKIALIKRKSVTFQDSDNIVKFIIYQSQIPSTFPIERCLKWTTSLMNILEKLFQGSGLDLDNGDKESVRY